MPPEAIAAALQAGIGIYQGVSGGIQRAKAKKLAEKLRPVYHIQPEIEDNQQLAESRASQGLTDASRTLYENEAARGYSAGIDAIMKNGGSVNNIADLYGAYENGINHVAMIDEEMRSRNLRNLMAQNERMAAERDKEFQINEYAPFQDAQSAALALETQGAANESKGLNTIGSAFGNYAASQNFKQAIKDVYGNPGVSNTATATAAKAPVDQAAEKVKQMFPGFSMAFLNL